MQIYFGVGIKPHMDDKSVEFNRLQKQSAEPRRKRAAALRATGETWATIGGILGVSPERARQLAKAYDGNGTPKRGRE